MRKLFVLFAIAMMSGETLFAQNAQVTFSSTTSFTAVEEGFHKVKFQLTNGSNANVSGLLEYVHKNTRYFNVEVDGNELTLNFVEGVHWSVWMKVFGAMGVSQIEIRTENENSVVDPMGFLNYFQLIN
jgi:hypothetical protein